MEDQGRAVPITTSGPTPLHGEPNYGPVTTPEWPWHEPTARAIVERLQASPHRVHQGAANIIAAEFLPDGTVGKAVQMALKHGWPKEAVLAGLQLAKDSPHAK